jgi:hypothetical protein
LSPGCSPCTGCRWKGCKLFPRNTSHTALWERPIWDAMWQVLLDGLSFTASGTISSSCTLLLLWPTWVCGLNEPVSFRLWCTPSNTCLSGCLWSGYLNWYSLEAAAAFLSQKRKQNEYQHIQH